MIAKNYEQLFNMVYEAERIGKKGSTLKKTLEGLKIRYLVTDKEKPLMKKYEKWCKNLSFSYKIKFEVDILWRIFKCFITFGLAYDGYSFPIVKRRIDKLLGR